MRSLVVISLLAFAPQTFAQSLNPTTQLSLLSSISVTAESVVSVQPDQVQLDIGVVTQATQSQAASTQNAKQLDAVLTALRKALGPAAEIRTVSYTLNPVYHYPRDEGEPKVTGYNATNIVRVTLDDLAKIGNAIDTATQAGANNIQRIQFLLKDETVSRKQALREAVQKARSEADTLAAALSMRVARVISVTEAGAPGIPMQAVMMSARGAADVATPIQAGAIEVRSNVTLTVEIK